MTDAARLARIRRLSLAGRLPSGRLPRKAKRAWRAMLTARLAGEPLFEGHRLRLTYHPGTGWTLSCRHKPVPQP